MSNLQLRLITAIVLAAVTLIITYVGGAYFAAYSCILSGLVVYEWISLTQTRQTRLSIIICWLFFILVSCLLIYDQGVNVIFITILLGVFVLTLITGKNAGWCAGGFLYGALPAVALSLLRGDEPVGFGAIIFLYAVVWGTDIAAYFNGRAIGGPKLAPTFSPNKTWSGAIGGAAAAIAGGCLVAYFVFDTQPGNIYIPLLAFILSIVSQFGDIGESWVKRHFSAKDSSNILPGHGGIMDRVDGLIVASIVLYIIGAFFSNADIPSTLFNLL